MTGKKVSFQKKPISGDADAWIENRGPHTNDTKSASKNKTATPEQDQEQIPIKRLTLDLPETLHRQLKLRAAMTGNTMARIVRRVLEEEFDKDELPK